MEAAPPRPSTMSPLHSNDLSLSWSSRLKDDTRSAHSHTEASMAPLFANDLDLMRYREFLRKLTRFVAIHETILLIATEADPWLRTLDYPSRIKLPALYRDINQLSAILDTPSEDSKKSPSRTPHNTLEVPLKTTAQRLGFLYVMEGSTLGGMIIAKRLQSHLQLSQLGGIHYFNVYQNQTQSKWQQVLLTLNAFCDESPASYPAILKNALHTFACYRKNLLPPLN